MHSKVQRYKLRNLGIALVINMVLGLFLCLFPWHLVPLSGPVNSTIAPYRYLVGLISGLLALLASRTDAPLVPVYITRNKRFLGPIDVNFGEPFDVLRAGAKATGGELQAATEQLMTRIYALEEP